MKKRQCVIEHLKRFNKRHQLNGDLGVFVNCSLDLDLILSTASSPSTPPPASLCPPPSSPGVAFDG